MGESVAIASCVRTLGFVRTFVYLFSSCFSMWLEGDGNKSALRSLSSSHWLPLNFLFESMPSSNLET